MVSPLGRPWPVQENGGTPPSAVRLNEYGAPRVADGRDAVWTARGAATSTTIAIGDCSPAASNAVKVSLFEPPCNAMPGTLQSEVPFATPPTPPSVDHVTCVITVFPDAVPATSIEFPASVITGWLLGDVTAITSGTAAFAVPPPL